MTKNKLEPDRFRLLELRAEVLGDVEDLEETIHALGADRRTQIETMDRAQDEEPNEVLDRLDDQMRAKLNEIGAALDRIESGDYGVCETCGSQISEERLRAVPYARLCASCQARSRD